MRRARQPDEQHRRPVAHLGHRQNRHHAAGKNKHAGLAGARDRPALPGQIAGDPAAQDAQHGDDGVDGHEVNPAFLDVQPACLFEIVGQPDEKEPPDRIGHELGEDERPGLPVFQQAEPGRFLRGIAGGFVLVAVDVVVFPGRKIFDFVRHIVKRNPEEQPGEPRDARDDERPMPAPVQGDGRHERRGDDRADVGARIENARGQRAFLFRKPQRHRLDRRRKIAAFAKAEKNPRVDESADAEHQRVRDRRHAPRRDGNRVADLGAELVNEPAERHQADTVRALKRRVHVAELLVGPVQLLVEDRLDERENLPVNVVDGRREKEQRANDPAVAANPGRRIFGV